MQSRGSFTVAFAAAGKPERREILRSLKMNTSNSIAELDAEIRKAKRYRPAQTRGLSIFTMRYT